MIQIIGASDIKLWLNSPLPPIFPPFYIIPSTHTTSPLHTHPLTLSHHTSSISITFSHNMTAQKEDLGLSLSLSFPHNAPTPLHLNLLSTSPSSHNPHKPSWNEPFTSSGVYHSQSLLSFQICSNFLFSFSSTTLFLFYIFHNHYYLTTLFTSFHAHSKLPNFPHPSFNISLFYHFIDLGFS